MNFVAIFNFLIMVLICISIELSNIFTHSNAGEWLTPTKELFGIYRHYFISSLWSLIYSRFSKRIFQHNLIWDWNVNEEGIRWTMTVLISSLWRWFFSRLSSRILLHYLILSMNSQLRSKTKRTLSTLIFSLWCFSIERTYISTYLIRKWTLIFHDKLCQPFFISYLWCWFKSGYN